MSTTNLKAKEAAFNKLRIPLENKTILCVDGGGMRGILTVQLLKKIEEIAGIPCYELFDMVAGTSTGAIISGLIASGFTAVQIEEKYESLVTQVFKKIFLHDKFWILPGYDKAVYRKNVKDIVKDSSLAQACKMHNIDLMITSKDITENEETFFTCFNMAGGNQSGYYNEVLLRHVLEATMSAPTYFQPYERFVDGGTTAYNNPSLAALMEAKSYDGKEKYNGYPTTLFSLGTGMTVKSIEPKEAASPGFPGAKFWIEYVIDAASQDASAIQVDTFRSGLMTDIDYRRYQISFDKKAIGKIPNRMVPSMNKMLWNLSDEILKGIEMDDVTKFDLVKTIGQSMVEKIMEENKFTKDFIDKDTKRDVLVTAFGDEKTKNIIKTNLKDPDWDKKVPTK
ncbi:MAG TPA: patatin-like phospholipase family protein [Bacteroidia bacterium]|nr:patatin-like phospholipase family protein [Bacteroidia bacterium]